MRKVHKQDPNEHSEPPEVLETPKGSAPIASSPQKNRGKRRRDVSSPRDGDSNVEEDLRQKCRRLEDKVARLGREAEQHEREIDRLKIEKELYASLVRRQMGLEK